jgi:hypothetical protein
MIYPCIIRSEENIVHPKSKTGKDKKARRHNSLVKAVSLGMYDDQILSDSQSSSEDAKNRCREAHLQRAGFPHRKGWGPGV